MIFLPLPFLTTGLLITLLADAAFARGVRLPLLAGLAMFGYALQAALIGMKWGFEESNPFLMISLASILPSLTWGALNDLSGQLGTRRKVLLLLLVITLIVAVYALVQLQYATLLDCLSGAQYVIFGGMLLRQAFDKEHALTLFGSRKFLISPAVTSLLAGVVLISSAFVDAALAAYGGARNEQLLLIVVGYANVVVLLLVALVVLAGSSRQSRRPASNDVAEPSGPAVSGQGGQSDPDVVECEAILLRLEHEMQINHLYRNENLNLDRLARRIGAPARQISRAIKMTRDVGVPQYVNTYRIRDACRLLEKTDLPITEISFTVGFTTKSNFNREFSRIKGVSPSEWRSHRWATVSEAERQGSAPVKSLVVAALSQCLAVDVGALSPDS